ncbi:MAG: phosphoethanolamine transferase CptA [Azonexus sp.]
MHLIDWRGLGRAFAFFWYFSAVTHFLLFFTGATGFLPLRQGFIFSLLWLLPLLVFPARARQISAVVGVVLGIGALVNLGYFAIYRQEFSQSVLFIIFESNPAEANEYVDQYLKWWMFPALLAFLAGAYALWRGVRPLNMRPLGRVALFPLLLAALLLPPALKVARGGSFDVTRYQESMLNRMEPAVPWQFLVGYSHYRQQLASMQTLREQAERIPPIADLADARAGKPGTLVLLLGESTSRLHMSLYGYARPTNPKLSALRGELSLFNQVFASRPYTIEALQQVLTFADQKNPDLYLTRPSIMNIMKQAGYRTYWITNQQTLTKRNTMLTNFSEQMDEQFYLNHQRSQNSYSFDSQVLEPLTQILADGHERRFIVIHLLGTHMRYKYRFPPEAEFFQDRSGIPDWADDEQADFINEYDNAVRYNDEVVASILDTLRAAGAPSQLVYFSDHGEDVYDTPPHDFIGRNEAKPTLPMYTVPFFVWRSNAWQADDARDYSAYAGRTYQLDHFIHTWADLSGLRFAGYRPQHSLINPAYQAQPILVGDPGSPDRLIDLLAPPKRP